MVRINDKDFDQDAIAEIYGSSGKLVETIRKRIEPIIGMDSLASIVFTKWFFRDRGTDNLTPNERISSFLQSKALKDLIEEYALIACETLWGNGHLYYALLHYKDIVSKAEKTKKPSERQRLISSIISIEHIQAKMFEVQKGTNKDEYRPLELSDLQSPIKNGSLCSSKSRIKSLRTTNNSQINEFMQVCEKVFDYGDYDQYRDKLLNAMGINVCPYCNRQYITPWGTETKPHSTADIDHFYSKDRFPFLALSLFNFIPSCQICNSRFKLTKDFYVIPHVNPHVHGFSSDARFTIDNVKAVFTNGVLPELSILCSADDIEIQNSVNTFHLNDLYKSHRDYAEEIIKKTRMYSKTKIDEYYSLYKGLFSSKEELYQIIYGNYLDENSQAKRPLSKLTQDLLFDLGVFR
ncbi:MAG: hypothetical protein IJP78_06355 [Clostridia bacterium]|nr:hypothetical protein [Clostridia bacterium]MBQ6960580.1 hypothetical protein [Clostridia bacterium]